MTKKIIALLIAGLTISALIGCSKPAEGDGTATTPPTTAGGSGKPVTAPTPGTDAGATGATSTTGTPPPATTGGGTPPTTGGATTGK